MDEELKSYLVSMESRLGARVDGVESRLGVRIDDVESRLLTRIDDSEQRTRSHTEVVETRLLSEFWKWARTADARYGQHQAVVGGLDIRVRTLEDRVADLERRPS